MAINVQAATATFGYTSIGSIKDTGDANYINAWKFRTSSTQSGTLVSMSVYVSAPVSAAPKNQFQVAIYADAGSGPGSLLVSSASRTISPNAWNTVPVSGNLLPNTSYWLAYNTNGKKDTGNNVPLGAAGSGQQVWQPQTFGSWPSIFGKPRGRSANTGSIYVTYNAEATVADITPPTIPASLQASAVSTTQINLSWSASTDNVATTGYRLESCQGTACTDFAQIATLTATSFNDTGLVANTPYCYRVLATDAAGNLSSYSAIASATTLSATDTMAPSVPQSLSATVVSSSQISLSWSASTDNVGVTGYRVYRDGAQMDTVTSPGYVATGLSANTTYSFAVEAYDAAGNVSGQALIAANTLPAESAPVNPSSFQTPHDTIPNFAKNPTIQSVQSGAWSSTATWTPRPPQPGDVVLIQHLVTYDSTSGQAATIGIASGGTLAFQTDRATTLQVGTLLVMPGGLLEVGTEQRPVAANILAEIVITNTPINLTLDPNQYGTGLLALGEVSIHGAGKSPTFVRLSTEPRAGHTTMVTEQPVTGWQPGDLLIIPDTRHMKWNEVTNWAPTTPQWEERTLQSVSADGKTLTLTSPLQFDHLGARDANGALTFLPHVANRSRNVLIRSAQPSGTKGHVFFAHRAVIDVRYARFLQLGRTTTAPLNTTTNVAGRYGLHAHHVMGPQTPPTDGYQFTLLGNTVDGGSAPNQLKWGIAIHDSHFGLIQDNVGYNYGGAVFMFEDGSESYNVVGHNFAMRSQGTGDRLAAGTEGTGFWFRGPNNYVRNNVAANLWGNTTEAAYGYKFFMRFLGDIALPNFPGADTSITGQYTTKDGNKLPILEFRDNEVYGAAQGMTYWWVNSQDPQPYASAQETVIKNLRIWHVFNAGVYHYPAARITFDGLVVRGKDPAASACCGRAWHGEDYAATNIVFRNADIQGMNIGVKISRVGMGPQTVEHSSLRNVSNIVIPTLGSANGGSWIPPRLTVLRNLSFAPWPGSDFRTIVMDWDVWGGGQANTTQRDEVKVYQYQKNTADNFQTYYTGQATQNVAGGIAPCSNTRPEISGVVCAIAAEP